MIDRLEAATGRSVSRETFVLLEHYVEILRAESARQNLVSRASMDDLWSRHIIDGAQLVELAPDLDMSWADVGSGAGLPGMVVAILTSGPVTLIEPRKLRAEFLQKVVNELGLSNRVIVAPMKAERASGTFANITARAVAPAAKLLQLSTHLSTRKTRWILPKGRSAGSELVEVRRRWHCEAETVPSLTDPDSRILVLWDVKAKGGR
ncbi:16S rRNA (guanine(527)-N(7))-methyltransferase RsmG [Sphingomonas sabuli]|uniref:Ribosomal RNA small subunit methyltransferase G n=1 Tax=Sphingomonas sabuli TaxID=2764186 RepID=A0A7G9L0E5_9SPHN|nr:16S rRNA (guanine(527)-N(7))-methyltransferase RsmG [Sphingomonas sabuli]QNM82094.1 16S rRNA (guanine(527)-N(7))-methyltransferase RsmG [Sphingomonas sabuli]